MKLYLIPAYEETIKNQGYGRIINDAEKKGYTVVVLELQIKNNLLSKAVEEAVEIIKKDENSVIIGFSTGALVAYRASTKIPVSKALFCSVSSILNDDIPKNIKPYVKLFGYDVVRELKDTEYGTSKANKSIFMIGSKEGRKMIGRSKKLAKKCNGELVIISDNEHELNNDYIKEITSRL